MTGKQVKSYEARALQIGDFDLLGEQYSQESTWTGPRLLWAAWALLAITIGVVFIWSAFAPLNKGVVASGAVSTQGSRQVLQSLDGGVVKSIVVKPGEKVKRGQILLELDNTLALTEYQLVRQQYLNHLGEQAVLSAEITGSGIRWPAEFVQNPNDPDIRQVMEVQQRVLSERKGLRSAQKSVLYQQTARLNERIGGVTSQMSSLNSQQAFISEELAGIESLYKQGLAPKSRLLALQRAKADLEGRYGISTAEVGQVRQTIGENRMQSLQIDAQSREDAVTRLATVQNELLQLIDKLTNQREVLSRTTIKSPANGVILDLHVNTVGGVVRPGEPIIEVVPTDDIIVVARIKPQDVDAVHVGQLAHVKLSGLNPQTTPQLEGKVRYVSADALVEPERGTRYYEVRVAISNAEIKRLGTVGLTPGMPADVLVDGGARTALQYMLQPITAAFFGSFRD